MKPLSITKIDLSHFRSYPSARLIPDENIIVLTGENGAGKTNILEAISLFSPAAQFRKARLEDYIHQGEDTRNSQNSQNPWTIYTDLETIHGSQSLAASLDHERDSNRFSRYFKLDGKSIKSSAAFTPFLSIAWLTPQMDRIFIDQSQYRRRFFDHLVAGFNPHFSETLTRYRKLLRERISLLRAPQQDDRWISLLEKQIAENGVALSAARLDFMRRYQPYLTQAETAFLTPKIHLRNWVEEALSQKPALEVEEEWLDKLKKSRAYDRETGSAQFGCHKMDLVVTHPTKNIEARHCSTGEQKAFLISMILAYVRMLSAEKDYTPIILLDEITAHLDVKKREALFGEIQKTGAQSWLTGTDLDLFSGLAKKASFFAISPGQIKQIGV